MPIITPRNVAMSDGKFEVSVYRGAADDRTGFGVTAKAIVDDGNRWEHWLGNAPVFVGYLMRRTVSNWTGSAWATTGGWQALSPAEFAAKEPVRFNPDVEATAAPGANMVNRVGLPIFRDEDGDGKAPTQPAQPASGEQARDLWSGELLTDPQGNPINVP